MVVCKQFKAECTGCGQTIDLYNYEGLDEDSRMGSHHCAGQDFIPEEEALFVNEREVTSNGD